jgi:hypothetical protein
MEKTGGRGGEAGDNVGHEDFGCRSLGWRSLG